MKHLNRIMVVIGLCFAHLYGQNQSDQQLSQQDQTAFELIGAMQESVKFNIQIKSQQQTPKIAQQENLIKDQFSKYLDQYLTQFGQVYEKQGGLMHAYRNVIYIASRNNKDLAITPNEYNLLLETLQQATNSSDWGSTINLELSVNKNGLLSQQNLNLHEIVTAIKQVPLPANYSMTSIMLGTAAVAAIAAGAYFAASSMPTQIQTDQQAIVTTIPQLNSTEIKTPQDNNFQNEKSLELNVVNSDFQAQPNKKRLFEGGLQRYVDAVTANPDLDNQLAADNHIAPDEIDAMIIHPVTETMMLPFDVKNRLTIAHQNLQSPDFKLGTTIDKSLEKIHQLNSEEGHAYIKSDEGDQSLGHTISNVGMARTYIPAFRGIGPQHLIIEGPTSKSLMLQGPGMSNEINYAQQAKQAFLAKKNEQLLLPGRANATSPTTQSSTTITPAQQKAITQLMNNNPQQFTTMVKTPAGSNVKNPQSQSSVLNSAATLPETQHTHDKALTHVVEVTGHAALEAPKLTSHLDPNLIRQPWKAGGNYFPAQ